MRKILLILLFIQLPIFFIQLSGCNKTDSPPIFSLRTLNNTCVDMQIAGVYRKGMVLDSSHKIGVFINATSTGAWELRTNTSNGFSFSGSGVLNSIGIQKVTLIGSGSPLTTGAVSFDLSLGDNHCSFIIKVDTALRIIPQTVTEGVVFSRYKVNDDFPYYSTVDTTIKKPLYYSDAQKVVPSIDIVYIFNSSYEGPGFVDPVTLSKQWYWEYDYTPWLAPAIETRFYITTLTKKQFDSVKTNSYLLEGYFTNPLLVKIVGHKIYPTGSCIGGRASGAIPDGGFSWDGQLKKNYIFGFMNTATGKKGLIYIRPDQSYLWPFQGLNFQTKVDIIKQQ